MVRLVAGECGGGPAGAALDCAAAAIPWKPPPPVPGKTLVSLFQEGAAAGASGQLASWSSGLAEGEGWTGLRQLGG